jgi:indole-3-glycerol phosphate synthase
VSADVLDRITAAVRSRLEAEPPAADLERRARAVVAASGGRRSLHAALARPGIRIIAECKRRSPSAGELRAALDPAGLAGDYEEGGAAAISVVTEPDFFGGDPAWVGAVRARVSLPVLRKDFLVSRRQLFESALLGADAVLLIVRIVSDHELAAMVALAAELGLEVLLEVHDDGELERALTTPARLIGVNARNLRTFEVDMARATELLRLIPESHVAVAESGISSPAAVRALLGSGVRSFLVGEYLLRAEDPRHAVEELVRCA